MSQEQISSLGVIGSASSWRLDPQRSSVLIAHRAMWGLVKVRGKFTQVDGAGIVTASGDLSGEIVITANSIDTGNAKRDAHPRSADFFDVEQYPDIVAVVTSGHPDGDQLRLQCDLTVHGVTQQLTVPARIEAASPGELTVSVETSLDRARFAMTTNTLGMLRPSTTITITGLFVRAEAA